MPKTTVMVQDSSPDGSTDLVYEGDFRNDFEELCENRATRENKVVLGWKITGNFRELVVFRPPEPESPEQPEPKPEPKPEPEPTGEITAHRISKSLMAMFDFIESGSVVMPAGPDPEWAQAYVDDLGNAMIFRQDGKIVASFIPQKGVFKDQWERDSDGVPVEQLEITTNEEYKRKVR